MTDHPHHPLSCRQLTEHSSAFLEGTLGDEIWGSFKDHLERCPPCAEYVRQMGMTVELVRRLPGDRGTCARAELVDRFRKWRSGGG
ncbi:MAG: anti-sigma factor [Alphaproteobacteria bacterium]|nr:anti-sigma factor [Alphaproteobacteria bacterium]